MSNSNIFHYPNHTPRSKMIRRLPTQQSSDKGTSIMHKGIHVYILGAFILNNAASLEITEKNELITNILLTNIDHSKTTHSFIKQTAVRTDGNKLEQLKNSFDNNKTQEHLKDINKANDENYHEIAKRSIYLDYSYIDKEYGNNKTEKITPTVNSTTVDECVGLEDYCNMTKEDYVAMLQNYIYPQTYEWILIATHTTVFIIGLVGNALVCIAVYRNHTMRTVTNYFIVNLAAADFMVILFCLPPTVLWDVTETWFLGNTLCKMLLYFQCGPLVRHLLPTQVQVNNWTGQDSYSRHMGYIVDIQFSGADGPGNSTDGAASLQPAILSPVYGHLVSYQRSDLAYPQGSANLHTPTYKMSATSKFCAFARAHRSRERLGIRIPLFLMTIAYHQIVRVLWKNEKIPGQAETVKLASAEQTQLRSRRKAAKMLVAVVIMFAVCYFPIHLLCILRYTVDMEQNDAVTFLALVSHVLCYANSAINPLIYNFMSGKKVSAGIPKIFPMFRFICTRELDDSKPDDHIQNTSTLYALRSQTTCVHHTL
ncbi:unnamed protein product [Diatraea saccharalis]|uniref:G-protein coupled receptors family 1 profile domain-containing protein n=1 Tax=Diatraea saccharalis TaxID=40085 RepID=A0A9N9R956_9NEOP|nr:unnamed protein product [Diatraea saccharalis]